MELPASKDWAAPTAGMAPTKTAKLKEKIVLLKEGLIDLP
jgi:hypothetical protein